MIEGVNDTVPEVDAIARFCKPLPVRIELYQLNAFDGSPFKTSPWKRIRATERALIELGIPAKFMTYGA